MFILRKYSFILMLLGGVLANDIASAQILDRILNRDERKPRDQPSGITAIRDPGIPSAMPRKVDLKRGERLEFSIQANTRTPGQKVEFLIRDFPVSGKIRSLLTNQNDRSQAIIVFESDPNSGATTDYFTFAVRYPGGRFSPVARVDLNIGETFSKI
ncbi:MAG: hypothetical protein AAF226_09465, partial [Verrucomicrobiota bacterium]